MMLASVVSAHAQKTIDLTLKTAVEIAMGNSYRIRQLELGIERTRYWLKARQAGLKSNVYIDIKAPNFNYLSDYKWNSTLQKDEIIKTNTGLWQMDLSIRQPVVLLGYPTNGYLSLNNKMYRYTQKIDDQKGTNFYNRYFIKYEQPLFLPNELKNDIEEAKLDLDRNELEYLDNQVSLIEQIGYEYYDLLLYACRSVIYRNQIENLDQVMHIVSEFTTRDTSRAIEAKQVQVELANARERLLTTQSNLRLGLARMKQRLRLDAQDSISVAPDMEIVPVTVDIDKAVEYGYTLRPRLRLLAITRRQDEINLQSTKGNNAFHMHLEMTYGLEKQDEEYENLWREHDNSYSVSVNAYVPIWDWGRRKYNIEAQEISIKRTDLSIEESRNQIKSEIINGIETLREYQQRALSMKENRDVAVELTAMSLVQYRENRLSLQDLLQIITRQRETENNFIDAYMGYRRALLSLMADTHYDYEHNISVLDRFRTAGADAIRK